MEKALEFVRRCRVGVRFRVFPSSLRFARPMKAVRALRRDVRHKVRVPVHIIRGRCSSRGRRWTDISRNGDTLSRHEICYLLKCE